MSPQFADAEVEQLEPSLRPKAGGGFRLLDGWDNRKASTIFLSPGDATILGLIFNDDYIHGLLRRGG